MERASRRLGGATRSSPCMARGTGTGDCNDLLASQHKPAVPSDDLALCLRHRPQPVGYNVVRLVMNQTTGMPDHELPFFSPQTPTKRHDGHESDEGTIPCRSATTDIAFL
jgi:hypothetical protein